MSSDTIGNIIDMTRTDPAFDALFQMFNVGKYLICLNILYSESLKAVILPSCTTIVII